MKCDMNCFSCQYEDCINDELTPEDIVLARKRDREVITYTDDYKKRWEQKNRQRRSQSKKAHYQQNKEKYQQNRQKYYAEHREEIITKEKERYQRNKEYMNRRDAERKKIRRAENPEYYRQKQREYRAKKESRKGELMFDYVVDGNMTIFDFIPTEAEKPKKMKILVACEESQAVTIELRKLGHEAYSCDIEPCSGGHPEWHIQQDVTPLLQQEWDMIIAFPPCTHLAVSGAAWFEEKRKDGRQQQGIDFFMVFANAKCERIAIENPIGIMSNLYRKPDQIIQPWMFGHPESKATCLWLKGLPKLIETENVKEVFDSLPKNQQQRLHYLPPSADRGKLRSKIFPGIAKAMAEQWAGSI